MPVRITDPDFEVCQKKLEEREYRQYAPLCLTKAEKEPRYPEYRNEGAEYLGYRPVGGIQTGRLLEQKYRRYGPLPAGVLELSADTGRGP
jgi:hypothetical protein